MCRSSPAISISRTAGPGLQLPGFDRLPDAVFVRGVPGGTLEQVVYYLDVLHALRHLGVLVYNDGRAIERSVDKGMTSFLLHAAGIPTPPTWVIRDPGSGPPSGGARVGRRPRTGPQAIVRLAGRGAGRGSVPPPDPAGSGRLQRYPLSPALRPDGAAPAQDWRVFVIGGRAVAAMRRDRDRGWITNVAQGATCHPAVLEPELRDLAEARGPGPRDVLRRGGYPARRGGSGLGDRGQRRPGLEGATAGLRLDIAAALAADLVRSASVCQARRACRRDAGRRSACVTRDRARHRSDIADRRPRSPNRRGH